MDSGYDSRPATQKHIDRVKELILRVRVNLRNRGMLHDASKMYAPEKDAFDILGERQSGLEYGTPEYFAQFDFPEMKTALAHHYAHNRHHPEYHVMKADGTLDSEDVTSGEAVSRMTLLDLLEMVCDWRASSERYQNGSIAQSMDINEQRFGLSPQLARIIRNTIDELGF